MTNSEASFTSDDDDATVNEDDGRIATVKVGGLSSSKIKSSP